MGERVQNRQVVIADEFQFPIHANEHHGGSCTRLFAGQTLGAFRPLGDRLVVQELNFVMQRLEFSKYHKGCDF
jgi:hypothetical protein